MISGAQRRAHAGWFRAGARAEPPVSEASKRGVARRAGGRAASWRAASWCPAALVSAAGALLLVACGGSEAPSVEDSNHPIDRLFATLGGLSVEGAKRVEGQASAPVVDGDYQCTTTPVEEVRHLDQLLGQIAIGDVLWPGAMLRGDSVISSRLTPLGFDRAPLTFSVSLESLGRGARSATLAEPSLSSYRDAIAQILGQELTGSIPARISAEVEEVSSEEQLAVALGASASAPLVGMVKGGFDFGSTTMRSRFVVKFFQLYYTVDVDPPGLPHEMFAPSVTAAEISSAIGRDPPVYVSSIGYGRQVIFTFESALAKEELAAALDFAYQGGAEVGGQTSLTHSEVLSHTHMTAFLLGGDAGEGSSVAIGDYDMLAQFITRGGNYSRSSPGAAIAYKLSYVRDNAPIVVSYGSSYSQRTCSRVTQRLRVVLQKLKVDNAGGDVGGDLEVFGTVGARGAGATQSLVSWPAANYVQVAEGQSFPPSGTIAEAIVPVRPQAGATLVIETSLLEADAVSNDSFGDRITTSFPFETGWRRAVNVQRSSGAQAISLQVSISPVP
jgi:thiol-activated cytolysin